MILAPLQPVRLKYCLYDVILALKVYFLIPSIALLAFVSICLFFFCLVFLSLLSFSVYMRYLG